MRKYFLLLCLVLLVYACSNVHLDDSRYVSADQANTDLHRIYDQCDDVTECPNELSVDIEEYNIEVAEDICP